MLLDALTLGLGYNATLVAVGATLLGIAAGVTGTFLYLRKRALLSDAISHATLPGVGLAFLVMVAFGGDGRALPGLLVGSALSAALGLILVQALTRHTRLSEDAAIGAVLSVFFGAGIVLLTVIQTLPSGRQAGLDTLLLGSTAGMLRGDALLIAAGGALVLALVLLLRRPLLMVAFDPDYALTRGLNLHRLDLAAMGLVLAVTVVGLKVVGLILIVALLIIPPVTARFWSDRAGTVVALAGVFGGVAGYVGAALSATAPALPTGPLIVLAAFALFDVSLAVSPTRGLLAALLAARATRARVHLRQGLVTLGQGLPVHEGYTRRLLTRAGLTRPDGVPTEAGRAAAAAALRDEARWRLLRRETGTEAEALVARDDGLTDLAGLLTPDQLRALDARMARPAGVTP